MGIKPINCCKYDASVEPRHFRYVGIENAKAITDSGLCLEEWIESKTAA